MAILTKELSPQEHLREAIRSLALRRISLENEIALIDKAIDSVQVVVALLSKKPTEEARLSKIVGATAGGSNRNAIVEILRKVGHEMTIAQIAAAAKSEGKIASKRGYRGIYATVSTVLMRNSKHVFVHLRRGVWDLRERKKKAPQPSEANGHRPEAVLLPDRSQESVQ